MSQAPEVGWIALDGRRLLYRLRHVGQPRIDGQAEICDLPKAVAKALGSTERKTIKGLVRGMRKNPNHPGRYCVPRLGAISRTVCTFLTNLRAR